MSNSTKTSKSLNNSSNIKIDDSFDELQYGIKQLSSIFSEYKKKNNIEIELRLGQIQFDTFKSGLMSQEFYNKIKNTLDSCKTWDKVINNKTEEICSNGLRRITTFNGRKVMKHQCIRKDRILNKNIVYKGTPYDIRISVSTEIPVQDKIKSGIIRNTLLKNRKTKMSGKLSENLLLKIKPESINRITGVRTWLIENK